MKLVLFDYYFVRNFDLIALSSKYKARLMWGFHPRKFLYEFKQEFLVVIVRCAKSKLSFVVKRHLAQLSQIQG